MEAISRLQRFCSALLGATGKFSRSVATDELDAWMLFEPHFQCGSLTIWKQVHRRSILSIDENGAVSFATAIGEFIHAEQLWRLQDGNRLLAQDPQNSHACTGKAKMCAECSSGLSSQRKAKLSESLFAPCGAPSRHAGEFWESLGKTLANTRFVLAKKAANEHEESQSFSSTGQVGKRARGVAVDTAGNLLTEWASGFGCFHRERQDQRLWCDFDLLYVQTSGQTE